VRFVFLLWIYFYAAVILKFASRTQKYFDDKFFLLTVISIIRFTEVLYLRFPLTVFGLQPIHLSEATF